MRPVAPGLGTHTATDARSPGEHDECQDADLMSRSLFRVALTVALSVVSAGVFYTAWMAAFIILAQVQSPVLRVGLWLAAPPVTAAGFAVGLSAGRLNHKVRSVAFLRAFAWPLAGCAIGAALVFPFGPMLIVFGMFLMGTFAVVIREVVASRPRGF